MIEAVAPPPPVHSALAPLPDLFAKDPLELSDAEFAAVVAGMRAKRHLWMQAEAAAAPRAKPKPKAEIVAAPVSLDLGELGL